MRTTMHLSNPNDLCFVVCDISPDNVLHPHKTCSQNHKNSSQNDNFFAKQQKLACITPKTLKNSAPTANEAKGHSCPEETKRRRGWRERGLGGQTATRRQNLCDPFFGLQDNAPGSCPHADRRRDRARRWTETQLLRPNLAQTTTATDRA